MPAPPANVPWKDVWNVVKASAERWIGRPVLVAYLVLAIVEAAVVAASLVAMHF